jgi:ethanolamine transporter EutH
MRKIVLTFGLISGAIISGMMALNIAFQDQIGFDRGEIIGYTSMVVAFLLIYFGVRSYRDNVAGGSVTFGRAFKVGALIAVVASVCYVATWQVIYFGFKPDFMEKYQAYLIEQARADGETEAQLAQRRAEMDKFAKLYRNPVVNAGVTLLEPLPVAFVITLVTAGVLSRQKRNDSTGVHTGARVMT